MFPDLVQIMKQKGNVVVWGLLKLKIMAATDEIKRF